MKFYPENNQYSLNKEIKSILRDIRKMRNFNIYDYIKAKSNIIESYFKESGLDTAIVAVSGGIDSAVVLAIMKYVKDNCKNTIRKIVPITLPLINSVGATNQPETIIKAKELCEHLNLKLNVFEIKNSFNSILSETQILGETSEWAKGQLTAYSRTPFLYYSTSILNSQGYKSVIIGTTNRDEGAYLGYVGKASDGIVDVQIISDLHKSEVYKLAEFFKIPKSILNSIPSGDMFDNRCDEEVFGASYDFVELYLNFLNLPNYHKDFFLNKLSDQSLLIFNQMSKNLEDLHSYNKHKYLIGSPAVHLDVMESKVIGGWIEGVHSGRYKHSEREIVITSNFNGFINYKISMNIELNNCEIIYSEKIKTLRTIKNFISKDNISYLKNIISKSNEKFIQTNHFGYKDDNGNGSSRISFYSESLALNIFYKLKFLNIIENIKFKNNDCELTNYGLSSTFRIKEVNPMFRILSYSKGESLVPHYDDSFVKNNSRSLVTLLIGVEDLVEGGETQFKILEQDKKPYSERNFEDHCQLFTEFDESIQINSGDLVLFDHRILHQSNIVKSGEKIVIRTEIIFESCD